MEILIALVIATMATKMAVTDVAHAVRGSMPPRARLVAKVLDQRAANSKARRERWSSGRHAVRHYGSTLLNDAFDAARQRHDVRHAKRSAKRRTRLLAIERGELAPRWIDRPGGFRSWLRGVVDDGRTRYEASWDRATERRRERATERQLERDAYQENARRDAEQPSEPLADPATTEHTPDPENAPETDAQRPDDTDPAHGPEPEQPAAAGLDERGRADHADQQPARPPLTLVPDPGPEAATSTSTPNGDVMTSTPTANGEVTGLAGAIRFAEESAAAAEAGIGHVEAVSAALAAGEQQGEAAALFASAQEQLGVLAQTFKDAGKALAPSLVVKEGYDAAPDTGTKQFVTAD